MTLEGKQMEMVAKDDITLRSLAGGVELSGGVALDTVMLPHGGGGYKVTGRVLYNTRASFRNHFVDNQNLTSLTMSAEAL